MRNLLIPADRLELWVFSRNLITQVQQKTKTQISENENPAGERLMLI